MNSSGISYLILAVSRSCNLSCRYCYEGDGKRDAPLMTSKTALKALQLAASSGKPFNVQLSGGEPLLAAGTVFAVLECIRREALPATVALQTNGTLLDRETIKRLRGYAPLSIGVSVDGPPGLQESLRGGSAATYRGMKLLDEERVPFGVTAVVTALNVLKLHQLAMSLHGFSMVSGIALDLLVEKGGALGAGEDLRPGREELRAGVQKLLETLGVLNRERARPLGFRELGLVRKAFSCGPCTHYCAASTGGSLAVTPEGTLYPCTQTMDDPEFLLGSLDRPFSGCRNRGLVSAPAVEGECAGCILEGRCPGDCPSRIFYNRRHGGASICALYRTIADFCVQTGDVVL